MARQAVHGVSNMKGLCISSCPEETIGAISFQTTRSVICLGLAFSNEKMGVYILDSSPVEFHLRWGCKATFNRAGKPENDPSSLWQASFYVKTTQDKSPRHAIQGPRKTSLRSDELRLGGRFRPASAGDSGRKTTGPAGGQTRGGRNGHENMHFFLINVGKKDGVQKIDQIQSCYLLLHVKSGIQ